MPDTTPAPHAAPTPAGAAIGTTPEELRKGLRSTILFADLDDEQIDHIASAGTVLSLRRNIVLFDEGAEPHEFYLVLAGRIAIAQESEDGRESLLALMGPGELFGELGFLDGETRSAPGPGPGGVRGAGSALRRAAAAVREPPGRAVERGAAPGPEAAGHGPGPVGHGVPGRDGGAPPSACWRWRATRTSSRCPSPRRNSPPWSAPAGERVNKAIHAFVRLGWITHNHRHYKITNRKNLTLRAR